MRYCKTPVLVGCILTAVAAVGAFSWLATQRPDAQLHKARAALQAGDVRAAKRTAERLEAAGHLDHARLLDGAILVMAGRSRLPPEVDSGVPKPLPPPAQAAFRQALRELSRIADNGPLGAEAAALAAECLVRLEERQLAAEGLEAVARLHPDHLEIHRWLAAIYLDIQSPLQAVGHLREWGRLRPKEGRPFRLIGQLYRDHFRAEEAVEAYREALRRQLTTADQLEVLQELAGVLMEQRADYPAALAELDAAPESLRDDPAIQALRAECLHGLGKPEEAVPLLDHLLQSGASQLRVLRLRAKIYLADGAPQKALPLLEKALQIDPQDYACRQALIQVYHQLKETAKAQEQERLTEEYEKVRHELTQLFERASRRPWDDEVRCQIAELCLQVGRRAEARASLRAALACNPANERARQRLIEIGATP